MSTCSLVGSDTCLSNSATRRISASERPAAVDLADRPDDFVEGTAMVFLNHPSAKGLRELRPVRSNHCIGSYVSLEVMIGLSVDLVKPFRSFIQLISRIKDLLEMPMRLPRPHPGTRHEKSRQNGSNLLIFGPGRCRPET